MKPISPSNPASASILAFGAHPDDIEFGCGGVIALETQSGGKAHFVVCSCGEAASHGTPERRREEANTGARHLGATLEFLEMGGDAHLENRKAHALVFARMIRIHRPRILFAPTTGLNQHPDHAVVGNLARDAARLARYAGVAELREWPPHAVELVLHYAVTPEGEPADRAAVLIDVSDEKTLTAWKESMTAHASQQLTRNYVELQLMRARLNGLRAGVGHAIALFPSDPLVFNSLGQLGGSARSF